MKLKGVEPPVMIEGLLGVAVIAPNVPGVEAVVLVPLTTRSLAVVCVGSLKYHVPAVPVAP